jgi:DNA-directed RNA polymerase specialized sigma24 family protein
MAEEMDDIVERDKRLLNRALLLVRKEISRNSWQAFKLSVLRGLTAAETAAQLKMSPASVTKTKSRVIAAVSREGRRLLGQRPAD